ncbi:hypothetical protein [Prauserella muralis]|uniref:Uncharacterized protein n=1 Tax=Prauserella muralis TaxID=588067 RepID=A0A2V4AYQ4_9PSEU|nr:hypothetical protein [Prauserella muralis]PXY26957.1 hypothetical protein BAY60_10675 [Prauserella muralis]TWE23428.1 hypothetical protein FHX69_4692 [Prauserella muralis]
MIRKDRELLARLSAVNTRLGEAVVELIHHQDGGELPAAGLRALGIHLRGLSTDLLDRADELDAVDGGVTPAALTAGAARPS